MSAESSFLWPLHLVLQQRASAISNCSSLIISPWNQGLLQCNLYWQIPWLALSCGQLPSAHGAEGTGTCSRRVLISLQWAWWGNQVDELFIFLFSKTAFDQPTSLNWLADERVFARKQQEQAGTLTLPWWETTYLVMFLRPSEERAHKLKTSVDWVEISIAWAKAMQRKAKTSGSDLKRWCLVAHYILLAALPHAAAEPHRCQPALPAMSPPHLPPARALGVTQTSLTDYNWNELYANRLGQSQIIQLPVTGPILVLPELLTQPNSIIKIR